MRQKRRYGRREPCKAYQLQPERVRHRTDERGADCQIPGAVEHQRKAEHTAKARQQPEQDLFRERQAQSRKLHRLQMQQQSP